MTIFRIIPPGDIELSDLGPLQPVPGSLLASGETGTIVNIGSTTFTDENASFLVGMVGNYLTIFNSTVPENNGRFLITNYINAQNIQIANADASYDFINHDHLSWAVGTYTRKRRILMVSGAEYVRQKIACRLKFFLGEWFLDLREGVPYYRDVFVQNPDLNLIRSIFRAVILSVQDVQGVTALTLAYDPRLRTLGVAFTALLATGETLVVRQPDKAFIISVQRAA